MLGRQHVGEVVERVFVLWREEITRPVQGGCRVHGASVDFAAKNSDQELGLGGGVSIDFCLILTRRAQQQITRRATTLWPLGTLL